MNFSKLTVAVATLLGAGVSSGAFALDLYVDTKTKQIFAEPGPRRERLGAFEKVEEDAYSAKEGANNAHKVVAGDNEDIKHLSDEVSAEKAEIKRIQEDLELKANELKALEEHVAENRTERDKNNEKWFNKINVRGYTQLRYNQGLTGDRISGDPELRSVGDSGIKDNSNFSFRRVRLVFSGDINEHLFLYIQPDFASNVSDNQQHFAQLRDAYADLAFDKKHEYRIRAGQSKVPFGWENLQSSQNRITLDRADALNSATISERDLGLVAYWSPEHVQKLWKDLGKKGLKTSGDYGIVGAGIFNGQGLNRAETNDDLYVVAHSTYPIDLKFLGYRFNGQVLEVGADAMTGYFNPTTANSGQFGFSSANKLLKTSIDSTIPKKGIREDRVGVHAILFPQPFGLQAEWNWGKSAALNPDGAGGTGTMERRSLRGGYVQAMYKIDNVFREDGVLIPYVKWQTYRGAWKAATNQPYTVVDEIEAGIEYQIMKAIEVTLAYSTMDRTNTTSGSNFLGQASGDLARVQLQWNY
jgi:uncharacterized coiled-coil protein SlyX